MKIDNIQKLCGKFSDDERHPLIVESDDWENEITPSLSEWGKLIDNGFDLSSGATILRVAVESIYVMGYNRGKKEG